MERSFLRTRAEGSAGWGFGYGDGVWRSDGFEVYTRARARRMADQCVVVLLFFLEGDETRQRTGGGIMLHHQGCTGSVQKKVHSVSFSGTASRALWKPCVRFPGRPPDWPRTPRYPVVLMGMSDPGLFPGIDVDTFPEDGAKTC